MLFSEILKLAFSSLTSNKLRSALTILGIAVGVFSVIGVMTFLNGMRTSIESGLNVLGANSIQISKWPPLIFSSAEWRRYRNRRNVTYPIATRLKGLLGDAGLVNLQIGRGGQSVFGKGGRTNPNIRVVGTDENFTTAFNYDVAEGRNVGPDDVVLGRPICVLGADVALRVFPKADPIGSRVRISGQTYTVVGVLAPKASAFGGNPDNIVLMPITRYLDNFGQRWGTIGINVQAPNQAALPALEERTIGLMRLVRGLHPEDPNDFEVFSNESLIAAFDKIADVVAIGALVISGIALLVSGVGVMNIMLVSVTERTKEIGIRKSIGAKKRNILLQFLAEAVVLSLIGGTAGIAVGVAGGDAVAFAIHSGIAFPWFWAGMGLFVCGGIGIVFGLYPAWKAASLDPIEALRFE